MNTDVILNEFNTQVRTCEACKQAQQELDEETDGGYVGWCDKHSTAFAAWAEARRLLEMKP
jgi:hypothetical protein